MSTDKITNVNTGELFDRIKDRMEDEQPDMEWREYVSDALLSVDCDLERLSGEAWEQV